MKIISPSKISGEIFTLIDEADKFVVLVSPYIQISGWDKLTNRFENIQNRDIKLEIFVRDGQKNLKSINELSKWGITPYLIPNLHSKLYFSEKTAIVTSMNLLTSSDRSSLEIGHKVESKSEYKEIVYYYRRYIKPHKDNISNFDTTLESEILSGIRHLDRVKIKLNFNSLKISTSRNQYTAEVDKNDVGQKILVISGILSTKEYENRDYLITSYRRHENLDLEFSHGGKKNYDMVIGFSNCKINSSRISNILNTEKEKIGSLISSFIKIIESFKLET